MCRGAGLTGGGLVGGESLSRAKALEQLFCLFFALVGFLFDTIDQAGDHRAASIRGHCGGHCPSVDADMQEIDMRLECTRYSQTRHEDGVVGVTAGRGDESSLDRRISSGRLEPHLCRRAGGRY
jgi:hypothetical protein